MPKSWSTSSPSAPASCATPTGSRTTFSRNSHTELRSPLSAIRTWASLLRGGRLDSEKTARAMEAIERSVITQAQLVEDLLDVSRIAAGKLALDIRPLDLAAVVEAALDAVRTEAQAKAIRIEQVLEPLAGWQVQGDPAR